MELRVLRYFLAVAREENMTAAAASLHVSQPTLSRQIQDLEAELGKQLFIREPRQMVLTEAGRLLRKRADEIVTLADKTEEEIYNLNDKDLKGDIYIGAGETSGIHCITSVMHEMQEEYPGIHIHITSGDGEEVLYSLENGLIDIGLVFRTVDEAKFNTISVPYRDVWGILMCRDDPLADKKKITLNDFKDRPLIVSRGKKDELIAKLPEANIVSTYTLLFNASIMVKDRVGYALTLDNIVNTEGTDLVFKELYPKSYADMTLAYKKYQYFSRPFEVFIEKLKAVCQQDDSHL